VALPVHDELERKSERLGLRATVWQLNLLAAASQAEGTTVSDFVLRYATRAAEDVLADRRVFMAAPDMWDRFATALDRPAREIPGLEQLMNTPTVIDEA
jgi:uncharacterized protein (DUF1778 family)